MYSLLCFGDSLTFGRGEIPSGGWVQRLKKDFETELIHKGVYNLGIPGETSQSLVKRIKSELEPRIWYRKENDKYVLILQIGGNDIKAIITKSNNVTSLENFKKNISEIINFSKKKVDKIIILGIIGIDENKTLPFDKNVFFSNKDILGYNKILKEISINESLDFIDFFTVIDGKNPDLYSDGIHLNSKGYDLFYKMLKEKITF